LKRAETLNRVFHHHGQVAEHAVQGFGAQSLVKDYFTGFFLLLENQIRQGDVVQLGDHAGSVEEVSLRYVQLRDYDGNVHYVPNGEITTVVNMTRGFSQAVCD